MTIAETQRRNREIYLTVLDPIVDALLAGDEPVALSSRLAEAHGLDHSLVYRWIQLVDAAIDRARRRRALAIVAVLWLGVAALIAGLLALPGWVTLGSVPWWLPAAAGVAVAVASASRLVGLRGRAAAAWVESERSAT